MIQLISHMRILVAGEPTDFRRGIDGLCRVCRQELSAEPMSGARFVFRNRRAKAVRILVYDRFVVQNPRFLVPPWVQVPHLASHVLGRMARMLPKEWQRVYGHPVYFVETFVDPTRFRDTCYRAANRARGP